MSLDVDGMTGVLVFVMLNAVVLFILWLIIRSAVLSALREHAWESAEAGTEEGHPGS